MTDHKFLNMRADAEEAATVPLISPESVEFELTLGRWEEVLAPATGALRQAHHDASRAVTADSTGQVSGVRVRAEQCWRVCVVPHSILPDPTT